MSRPVAVARGRAATTAGVALAAALLLCLPAAAAARSIAIEEFHAAIRVEDSTAIEVVETIRLRFEGAWRGIHRFIPVEYRSSQGIAYHLAVDFQGVTDGAGTPLTVERSRRGNDVDLKIYVPAAEDATRTVVVRYRIANGLRFFDDHDELYWNVTGDQWPYPIRVARATVALPGRLVNVRANAFTGAFGSRERAAAITIDGARHEPDDAFAPAGESPPPDRGGHVVEVEATRPLGIREGLSLAVAWNPGGLERPSAAWQRWTQFTAWLSHRGPALALLGVPLAAFAWLLRQWSRVGRDPPEGPIVVQYEPPPGLGAPEVGTLVDNRPDNRDLIAGLVDAAVHGAIRIREQGRQGRFGPVVHRFELLVPEREWPSLRLSPSSVALLRGVFEAAAAGERGADGVVATVATTDLEERFYSKLPGIKTAIFGDLIARRFYAERPDEVVSRYVGAGIGAGVVVAAAGLFLLTPRNGGGDAFSMGLPILAGIATVAVIAGFGLVMPARTVAGAKARAAIRGFQEFLSRVESHRLATLPLTPELFERYLPYAIALGVEKRWAGAFATIVKEPPRWYVGTGVGGDFDSMSFTHDLGRMSRATAAAMVSAPRSSDGSAFGGSGSDGGGFSGGGFGGGGGEGF